MKKKFITDEYRGAIDIILNDFNAEQQDRLMTEVMEAVNRIEPMDVAKFSFAIMNNIINSDVKQAVVSAIITYFTNWGFGTVKP